MPYHLPTPLLYYAELNAGITFYGLREQRERELWARFFSARAAFSQP